MTGLEVVGEGTYKCSSIHNLYENLENLPAGSYVTIPRVTCTSVHEDVISVRDSTNVLDANLPFRFRWFCHTFVNPGYDLIGLTVEYGDDSFTFRGFDDIYRPPRTPSHNDRKSLDEILADLVRRPLGNLA